MNYKKLSTEEKIRVDDAMKKGTVGRYNKKHRASTIAAYMVAGFAIIGAWIVIIFL